MFTCLSSCADMFHNCLNNLKWLWTSTPSYSTMKTKQHYKHIQVKLLQKKNTSHAKNISKFQVIVYSPKHHWSLRWENVELWICQAVAIIQNSLKSQTEGHQKKDLLTTSGRVTSRMEACDRLKTVHWWILLFAKKTSCWEHSLSEENHHARLCNRTGKLRNPSMELMEPCVENRSVQITNWTILWNI